MKSGYPVVIGLLLVVSIVLIVAAEHVGPETYKLLYKEGGVVELLSAVSYFVAAALLLVQTVRYDRERWCLFVLVLCCGMRELDFDKRFSTMGVFKSKAYISPEVPLGEKLLGVLIITALLVVIFISIRRYFRILLSGLRQRSAMAWSVLLIGATLGVAKLLDGFKRKLKPLGIQVSEGGSHLASSFEEVLELAASLLVLVVSVAAFRSPALQRDGAEQSADRAGQRSK